MTLSLDVPQPSSELDIAFLGDRGIARLPVASAEPVPALARAAVEVARAADGCPPATRATSCSGGK
jgi:hypothetical protein